jgi:hypothetical protein
MEWTTPKIDWYGYTDDNGDYQGDRFNASDYNRIKNNIQYLRDIAVQMYADFDIADMGGDKSYSDYPYADEINLIENNLDIVTANTFRKDYGTKQIYTDNGAFIDFAELNRIESASLDLYNQLKSQYEGRRMLTFMLGRREVF